MNNKVREITQLILDNDLGEYMFRILYIFKYETAPSKEEQADFERTYYDETSSYEDSYDSYDEE